MNPLLTIVKESVYKGCSLNISNFKPESESKEYGACQFQLGIAHIICRNAKITPKKVGQFVTFWKRSGNGPIEPFHETDAIDFFVVNIVHGKHFGQFVFPKTELIEKGIISTIQKEGKRAFRVYPPWDTTNNKQAEKSQKWQLNYFLKIDSQIDVQRAKKLYRKIQH